MPLFPLCCLPGALLASPSMKRGQGRTVYLIVRLRAQACHALLLSNEFQKNHRATALFLSPGWCEARPGERQDGGHAKQEHEQKKKKKKKKKRASSRLPIARPQ